MLDSRQQQTLLDLAQKYGAPLYVYDAQRMKQQYDWLCQAFKAIPVRIKYACKALSNLSVLQLFRYWGSDVDTVSIQEVELALQVGFPPERIIFTPNCVSFEEIQASVAKGVVINIENLPSLEQFGRCYGSSVPCCIRLNPHILAGGNPHLQTGHKHAKFGISIQQLPEVLKTVARYNIEVTGLHAHTGSEIWEANIFETEAQILYDAAYHFPHLRFLDCGGGFKVAYREGDVATDIEELAKVLVPSFSKFCSKYGKTLELWLEPGKFLVSEAGYLLVRTNVVKQTGTTVFAGVDSGQNHLIRPMFYNAYHQILNLSNPHGVPQTYTVVGYICETDNFAEARQLPEIRPGDILCFCNAGAYGFTMSSNYNSRLRPAEVLVWEQQDYLIRQRETLEDLLRNQILIGLPKI